MVTLEIVVMPKTNSKNGCKWENYKITIPKIPEEKIINLTLKNKDGESVSEDFEIKNFFDGEEGARLRTAYTVVSDTFYEFLKKHTSENP